MIGLNFLTFYRWNLSGVTAWFFYGRKKKSIKDPQTDEWRRFWRRKRYKLLFIYSTSEHHNITTSNFEDRDKTLFKYDWLRKTSWNYCWDYGEFTSSIPIMADVRSKHSVFSSRRQNSGCAIACHHRKSLFKHILVEVIDHSDLNPYSRKGTFEVCRDNRFG